MPEGDGFAYFTTTGVPALLDSLLQIQRLALRHGLSTVAHKTADLTGEVLDLINAQAVRSAADADTAIIAVLLQTKNGNRPFTGTLESHIRSLAEPLGSVSVALVSELDKAVNPVGHWGPFWRAQEYGTGSEEVPSQVGRVIRGIFQPSGTAPDAAQRGLGVGTDMSFISDAYGTPSASDKESDFGTIEVELPGRHFLRDGTAEAAERYLKAMAAIQQRIVKEISVLTQLARAEMDRQRPVRGVISM
jgi:hypothetical protein